MNNQNNTQPAERPTPDVKPMGAVTICRNGYVEDLERQLAESREQRDRLASAIRSFSTDFEEIRWGWDGDCGSDRLAERLLNEMTETMKGSTNESR